MQYNFVIVRTGGGSQYAKHIKSSIMWLNRHVRAFKKHNFTVDIRSVNDLHNLHQQYQPGNTIIYARAAYPSKDGWMGKLINLEQMGFTVVNKTSALLLTSNKLECALFLQDKVKHPKSWEYKKTQDVDEFEKWYSKNIESEDQEFKFLIAKPLTSINQGADVQKIDLEEMETYNQLMKEFNKVPGEKIVVQEFVNYTSLHRVIVINGKALPYTFIDRPEWHKDGWKVSCCLNKETMKFNDPKMVAGLLELAEKTQKIIGGEINFIDIFEDNNEDDSPFTIGEINTACNLRIHEMLAKKAGRDDWNIHYRIARYLVDKRIGM